MSSALIGVIYTINQEETMEKVKQVWTWAKAHPQTSIVAVIVVVAIYFLVF